MLKWNIVIYTCHIILSDNGDFIGRGLSSGLIRSMIIIIKNISYVADKFMIICEYFKVLCNTIGYKLNRILRNK